MRLYKILIAALVPILVVSGFALAQGGSGIGWYEIPGDVRLSGQVVINAATGIVGTLFDANGTADAFVLDADADTTLSAETDDQIDIEMNGSNVISLTTTTLDLNDHVINQDQDTENVGNLPTWLSVPITYADLTLATVADGEIWIVHDVILQVTSNYNCTGDDCVILIGDSGDADGFMVTADADLQAAATEYTGSPAGWQNLMAANRGVYLDEAATGLTHRHIYAPSGSPATILLDVQGTSPAAGAGTVYILYTRLQ